MLHARMGVFNEIIHPSMPKAISVAIQGYIAIASYLYYFNNSYIYGIASGE